MESLCVRVTVIAAFLIITTPMVFYEEHEKVSNPEPVYGQLLWHTSPLLVAKVSDIKGQEVQDFKPTPITDDRIQQLVQQAQNKVQAQIKAIKPELEVLKDFKKGFPVVRGLIATTWRSGSTLTGELMNSFPGSFYSYEPLSFSFLDRIYEQENYKASTVNVLKGIFQCNFTIVQREYKKYKKDFNTIYGGELVTRNKALGEVCSKKRRESKTVCRDPQFLNNICSVYPVNVMKTVRMGLELAYYLMQDPSLANLKVVHIARDPRGLVNSRKHRDWCVNRPSCVGAKAICSDSLKDYHAAQRLKRLYPDRFRAVRYEDLSLDIWNTSRSLLQFFDLDMEPTVESFLKIHTEKDKFQGKPKVWNTFRDPLQAPVHWKHELSFDEIKQIQDECQEVMRLWGYKTVSTKEELLDLVPIMPYKL